MILLNMPFFRIRIFLQGIGSVKQAEAGVNGLAFGFGCQELIIKCIRIIAVTFNYSFSYQTTRFHHKSYSSLRFYIFDCSSKTVELSNTFHGCIVGRILRLLGSHAVTRIHRIPNWTIKRTLPTPRFSLILNWYMHVKNASENMLLQGFLVHII